MLAEDRLHRILALLQTQGRIEAEALAEALSVSRETIRRDLLRLETEGRIRRIHGGASALEPQGEAPFEVRRKRHAEEKRRIARAAVRLLRPGQSCFIDAGTTTAAFAAELVQIPDIAVVTNAIEVATTLRAARPAADIVLLGGRPGSDVPATYGELALEQLRRFRADLAIISPVGVHPVEGVTYYDLAEAEVARLMLARAGANVVLADRSKLGVVSRVTVCGCDGIGTLVTDRPASLDELRAGGLLAAIEA